MITFNSLILPWLEENWPKARIIAADETPGWTPGIWLCRKLSKRWEIAAVIRPLFVEAYIEANKSSHYWGKVQLSPSDPSYLEGLKQTVSTSWDVLGTFGERYQ